MRKTFAFASLVALAACGGEAAGGTEPNGLPLAEQPRPQPSDSDLPQLSGVCAFTQDTIPFEPEPPTTGTRNLEVFIENGTTEPCDVRNVWLTEWFGGLLQPWQPGNRPPDAPPVEQSPDAELPDTVLAPGERLRVRLIADFASLGEGYTYAVNAMINGVPQAVLAGPIMRRASCMPETIGVIDAGQIGVGCHAVASATILNVCPWEVPLLSSDWMTGLAEEGFWSVEPLVDRLAPGEEVDVTVHFTPSRAGTFPAGLSVYTPAGKLFVDVQGTATEGPCPEP